jgi:predicted PurR-regulated permease PerM
MELNRDTMKKLLVLVAFGVLLHWGLQNLFFLREVLGFLLGLAAPFILGGCIAFILNVPMSFLERYLPTGNPSRRRGRLWNKSRRAAALVLTLTLLVAVFLVGGLLIVPEISSSLRTLADSFRAFPQTLARWAQELSPYLPELSQWVNSLQLNWQGLLTQVLDFLKTGAGSFLGSAWNIAAGIFNGLFTFILGFIFACYILFQKEGLRKGSRRLLYAYLPLKRADRVLEVASLTYATFASFLSGQCLEAVILGLMFFVSLSVLGFPYALMISVLIAFTALIPIFGAFIGCAVGAFMILMLNPMDAVWFVVLFLVLQQVEGNLIYPRVVGGSVGLPSIWVLVAVTVGGSTMGVAGMLLFIPISSVLYTLLNRNINRRLAQRKLNP